MSADKPAPRRQRRARQPSVAAPIVIFEDPPANPPIDPPANPPVDPPANPPVDPPADPPVIRPPGFLSRFRPAPPHTIGLLTGRCTACGALYFSSTDGLFEPCYKKGDVTLPRIREPPPYLSYLFMGDDPLCRGFQTNIRAYNCAFAFTSISYKKDTRIDFSCGI